MLTIGELQKLSRGGDERALIKLGLAVLNFDFCMHDRPLVYCAHLFELNELKEQLDTEIPPQCPHCGEFCDTPVQEPPAGPIDSGKEHVLANIDIHPGQQHLEALYFVLHNSHPAETLLRTLIGEILTILRAIQVRIAELDVDSAVTQPATNEREPAQQQAAVPIGLATSADIEALRRFADCCEDCDADGHDVGKNAMKSLEKLGAVRSIGFNRHETTTFGDWLLASTPQTVLPVQSTANDA